MNSILRLSVASIALVFGVALAAPACSSSDSTAPGSCTDGAKDGAETDLDCGGPNCDKCFEDQACISGADCQTGSCQSGKCATPVAPTCTDKVMNGQESDVDCGGPDCTPCGAGKACTGPGDCGSAMCVANKCIASMTPTCTDGVKNAAETDVDCGGGTCPACGYMKDCQSPSDCLDFVCTPTTPATDPPTSQCAAPTCQDGKQNSDETDVDCGGSICQGCASGKKCLNPMDCASGTCLMTNVCM